MIKASLLQWPYYLLLTVLFVFEGCATPNIQMPDTPPPIVKAYKHVLVHGGQRGLRDTGIYLKKGDYYSIIATGKIKPCQQCPYPSFSISALRARIGDSSEPTFSPYYFGNGTIVDSVFTGNLHLGYRARNPDDDTGAFKIDIIVWAKEDYEAIYTFFKAMLEKAPENEALKDAVYHAERLKKFQIMSAKANQEIDETKKEIQALSEAIEKETDQNAAVAKAPPSASEDKGRADRYTQLKAKLEALQTQLVELDEMKRQFELEKQKSAELSKKLAEKERKEQELVNRLKGGSQNAPVIVIASPRDNSKVEVKIVEVSGVIEDETGVTGVEIFINGKPIGTKDARGIRLSSAQPQTRYDFRERIALETGDNQIRIAASDTAGMTSEKTVRIHYTERRKNIWAVIVGIDQYPNIRKLRYAVNDARAFYRHLVDYSSIPAENITLLLDRDASLTKLRSALGTHLKNNAGPDDMVIIYFAGHGATEKDMLSPDGDGLEKYLLPFDADPQDLYATALPMGEISRIFGRIRSDRLVFIADSCYSGATGGRTIGIDRIRANLSEAFFDRITSGRGRVIISASGANEVSAERDDLQQGVFTYYLLQGLQGKADIDSDGLVTVDEAFRFVSYHVPRATGQEKHPIKKGTVEGRLVLSVVR